MQHLILALALTLSSAPALAQEDDLEAWAGKQLDALTAACGRTTHAEWVKRYKDQSVEVMNELKTLDVKTWREYDVDGGLRTFVADLYPQHAPQAKRKGAPNPCFSELWDFTKAGTKKERRQIAKGFESCNLDRHAGRLPDAVKRVLDCWKALKD